MSDITTRTIIIGVGLFVTLTIVGLLVGMFGQMREIFGMVNKTDTSIKSQFEDIYSMYNGKVESGVGLLNTIKKFEDEKSWIKINYPQKNIITSHMESYYIAYGKSLREAVCLKGLMENNKCYDRNLNTAPIKYEDKYIVSVEVIEGGITQINFSKVE